jgi:DNA-binding NarL/FixJ family response regulator
LPRPAFSTAGSPHGGADERERTEPARLVVADDHELVRRGLRDLLAIDPNLEVVGEATNGREALELCCDLRPDLVLMNVRMPVMDGIEATREIKRQHPEIGVLVLSIHDDPVRPFEALDAGAAGYVLKDTAAGPLLDAVRRTLAGESPLDQELATELFRRLLSRPEMTPAPQPELPERLLTARESEVLRLLFLGCTNRQIARSLTISHGTAKCTSRT